MKPIDNYKNQFVRDLAWVIGSPPILINANQPFLEQEWFANEYKKFVSLLNELDENPQQLIEHINNGNTHLLGKYFESLVEYWLKLSLDKKLLAHNLQVFKGRNTVGEYDFIYRDNRNNKVYHLECAGKFYIAHKNTSNHSNFIGPNAIDNLENKLNKIFNEQILLSKTDAGMDALLLEDINQEITPKIFFKGYLFYYSDLFFSNSYLIPKDSNPDHPKGWWIYAKNIDYFLSQRDSKWTVVQRSNWISKVILFNKRLVLSNKDLKERLKAYFSDNSYPLLIAELKETEQNQFEEISRGFVVYDTWPDLN